VYALQEARTFPSDQPPPGFGPGCNQAGSLFKVTSIRRGNSRGGFYGQQGLPSKPALAAHIPGAQSIP
jgi:hypothetical protein